MRSIILLVIACSLIQWACAMQRPMVMRKKTAYSMIEKGQECSICFDELKKKSDTKKPTKGEILQEALILTSCNHVFHKRCLKEWQAKKNTCPICRKPEPLPVPSQPQQTSGRRISFCICS